MSCRQYTCPNCWNEPEARCLSCAPLELPEPPVRLEDLAAFGEVGRVGEAGLIGEAAGSNGAPEHDHDGWPEAAEAPAQVEAQAPDASDAVEAADMGAETPVAAEANLATAPVDAAPAEEAPVEEDAARKAAAQTTGLLRRFRPGQSLDAELEAFERERSDVARPASPEQAVEAPSPAAEPAPQLPAAVPEPHPMAAASPMDVVEQPTWTITAPDAGGAAPIPPTSEPGGSIPLQASATQPGEPGGEPQWPARSQWPGATPAAGLPFLGRPAAGQGGIEALWAASNQELVTAAPTPGRAPANTGIQPCVSCGLSLSATARFCRRCGTLQVR